MGLGRNSSERNKKEKEERNWRERSLSSYRDDIKWCVRERVSIGFWGEGERESGPCLCVGV